MKITHILFIMALLLASAVSAQTERQVFWLHGYQGDAGALALPKTDVSTRFKVDPSTDALDYSGNQSSLHDAASTIRPDIITSVGSSTNTEQNFIIAHSMGGLVARKMGMITLPNGNKAYNGLITFGTPHLGADPANTMVYHPEKVAAAINDACNSLGPALLSEQGFEILIMLGIVDPIANLVCQGISYGISSYPYPLFGLFETGIEPELTTQAVSTLAPMATDHNVVFYGIEDGKNDHSLTPRFIGALLHPPNDFPLYQADDSDQMGMAFVTAYKTLFLSKWNHYRKKRIKSWILKKPYRRLERAYRNGFSWFGRLDPTWKDLIGLESSSTVTQQGCLCREVFDTDYGPALGPVQFFPNATDCNDVATGNLSCYPIYTTETTYEDSDAWVTAETAMASEDTGRNYLPRKMDGSNHMQMKNDSRMEEAINLIFMHGMGEGPSNYFYTEER